MGRRMDGRVVQTNAINQPTSQPTHQSTIPINQITQQKQQPNQVHQQNHPTKQKNKSSRHNAFIRHNPRRRQRRPRAHAHRCHTGTDTSSRRSDRGTAPSRPRPRIRRIWFRHRRRTTSRQLPSHSCLHGHLGRIERVTPANVLNRGGSGPLGVHRRPGDRSGPDPGPVAVPEVQ